MNLATASFYISRFALSTLVYDRTCVRVFVTHAVWFTMHTMQLSECCFYSYFRCTNNTKLFCLYIQQFSMLGRHKGYSHNISTFISIIILHIAKPYILYTWMDLFNISNTAYVIMAVRILAFRSICRYFIIKMRPVLMHQPLNTSFHGLFWS